MQDDISLIQKSIQGSEEAFRLLVEKYYGLVYNQIASVVHDPRDAEELTNDTFAEAYQNLPSLRQPSSFVSWLRQIANYHCLDWQRRTSKRQAEVRMDDVSEELICEENSAIDRLIQQESLDAVKKAIDKLPKEQSRLMHDFYLDGDSYRTLQERYNLSENRVKKHLFKARQKVRQQLKDFISAIAVFWQRVVERKISGIGVETMKMSVKGKLVAAGAVALLMFGGASVLIWHHQRTQQEILLVGRSLQEAPTSSSGVKQELPTTKTKKVAESLSSTNSKEDKTAKPERRIADEPLAGQSTSDKPLDKGTSSANKDQEKDESAQQANIIYWRQEVQKYVTEYRDLMEDAGKLLLDLTSAPQTEEMRREEKHQRRNLEQKREELLSRAMEAIFNYVRYSNDYDGVNTGGWVDQIWGDYVKVEISPPSAPGEPIGGKVLTPIVLGGTDD